MLKRIFWLVTGGCAIGLSAVLLSPALAQNLHISQQPLLNQSVSPPPMNMMVMGRDHSLFYEAYNDASDLTGNGVPDVGYKPLEIDYYGYFDSFKCYSYSSSGGGVFIPVSETLNKKCTSGWSGDFLNWVTTSRIDALRKVLYGGHRGVDEVDRTVLWRSYIPQDAHSWGKEYHSFDRDGYRIEEYTTLTPPSDGRYHLFANTSLTSGSDRPLMRVLRNTTFRVWEWVAREAPVAGDLCGSGQTCTSHSSGRDDYTVRVEVCREGLLEENCKRYSSGSYKPVGLLQEFGEEGQMHFGLITGSYLKNMSGGVLRKKMDSIASEINPTTGQIEDGDGIIRTIDSFQIVDFESDHEYFPGWSGAWLTNRSMNESEFPDWGNPVAEMVYESLRYFAGKEEPTASMVPPLTAGSERVPIRLGGELRLPVSNWDDPFENRPWCTMSANLIISNVDISHDGDLVPGSAFSGFSGDLPEFNAGQLGQEIWNLEHGGSGQHFIGQVGAFTDGAPTVKTVSSLGNIRGLSPSEPTKEGTYYSASAARYGIKNNLRPDLQGEQLVETFSVALASQLPKIEFPVDGQVISMVPFGKSASSSSGCEAPVDSRRNRFQPMAQIVDYFVEEWVNTDPSNQDDSVNEGRPYASFRINFEDVEQAADHDMDSIVRYVIQVTADGELSVSLTPEYYSGCIKMNLGYVISGVDSEFLHPTQRNRTVRQSADGLYLEVRGDPGDSNTNMAYYLNTPPQLPPGACAETPIQPRYEGPCQNSPGLPPGDWGGTVTRTFSPSGSPAASVLRDPLWYAAKYGNSSNADLESGVTPENYFLVTNAATLAEQLNEAFQQILSLAETSGLSSSSTRLTRDTVVYIAGYDSDGWQGDLESVDALTGDAIASAADALLAQGHNNRNIYTWDPDAGSNGRGVVFEPGGNIEDRVMPPVPSELDYPPEELFRYLAGDLDAGAGFMRERTSMLGDIVNSEPVYVGPGNQGWGAIDADYLEYIDQFKRDPRSCGSTPCPGQRPDVVLVGANDGMLHAFDAVTLEEHFAYVPSAVHAHLHELANPVYSHRFFVDGKITIADVKFGTSWQTVMVGALGAGGRGVYALNITEPDEFTPESDVLWEFTAEDDPDLGYVFGEPAIGRLGNGTGNGTWVAVFGNGYNSENNRAHLFVINLQTGELMEKIALGDPGSNGLSGVSLAATVEDRLHIDSIYAGDLLGNMWRVDVDESNFSVPFSGAPLFSPSTEAERQPVIAAPGIGTHPVAGKFLYFGTGKLIENSDLSDYSLQRFYAVRDLGNNTDTVTSGQLDEVTMTAGAQPGTRRFTPGGPANWGWRLNLALGSNDGERILSSPQLLAGRVIFRSFEPSDDACLGGGLGRDYVLQALSGAGAFNDDGCLGCGAVEIPGAIGGLSPTIIYRPRAPEVVPDWDPENPPDPGDPGDGPPPVLPGTGVGLRSDQWWGEVGTIGADGRFRAILRLPEGRAAWRERGMD